MEVIKSTNPLPSLNSLELLEVPFNNTLRFKGTHGMHFINIRHNLLYLKL